MASEAKNKAKNQTTKDKRLKILTPKQLLQRLPIVLAEVKAGNNFENLMKSRKIFIFCINNKKSLKKYTIT